MTDEATPTTDAQSAGELADENDKLRAELEASNAALRAKIAESQAAVGDTGHTDEDVRRLEHPEEFAHEQAAPAPAAEPAATEG